MAQEIMLSGGLTMPLSPYSAKDILDNTSGHALNGYNIKLDYIILKLAGCISIICFILPLEFIYNLSF